MVHNIPLYPTMETSLSMNEKNCLSWYVLSGCSKKEAFGTFLRQDLAVSPMMLDKYMVQFFDSKDAKAYIEAYSAALDKFTGAVAAKKESAQYTPETRKKKKEEAVQRLMDFVIEQSLNIEDVEDKDDIIKFADKLGLLEGGDDKPEEPRRYLPVTCSECAYKKFIEENCVVTQE